MPTKHGPSIASMIKIQLRHHLRGKIFLKNWTFSSFIVGRIKSVSFNIAYKTLSGCNIIFVHWLFFLPFVFLKSSKTSSPKNDAPDLILSTQGQSGDKWQYLHHELSSKIRLPASQLVQPQVGVYVPTVEINVKSQQAFIKHTCVFCIISRKQFIYF